MFVYDFSYAPEVVKVANPDQIDLYNLTNITYDYNYYYKNYEDSNFEKQSVLEIPNGYMLQAFNNIGQIRSEVEGAGSTAEFTISLFGLENTGFVTREGKAMFYYDLFLKSYEVAALSFEGIDPTIQGNIYPRAYFEYFYPIHSVSIQLAIL